MAGREITSFIPYSYLLMCISTVITKEKVPILVSAYMYLATVEVRETV